MFKKVLFIVALVILAISFVGCSTVQGIGEDITWTGEKGAEVLEGN